MLTRLIIATIMAFSHFGAVAAEGPSELNKKDRRLFDSATAFLQSKSMSKTDVEKTVTSEVLEKTTTSSGRLFAGGHKLRWETESPEKSMILFDGTILWTFLYPSDELGGPIQVTKSKLDIKAKTQILVRLVTSKEAPSKNFDVLERTEADGIVRWKLKPKQDDPTVKDFSVAVESKKKLLREIEYRDEIGNKTTLKFGIPEKIKNPDAKQFKAEVPKGAQVTEL